MQELDQSSNTTLNETLEVSETVQIMRDRLHECLVASRHLIITEGIRKIHMIGVNFTELWNVKDDWCYYVEAGFLLIEQNSDFYIVEAKTGFLIDEYTKFGSIPISEIMFKMVDTDILEDFREAYKRMRGV